MADRQQSAARTPEAQASAWERRTLMVKAEQAAASAATDAKTARLRALRLEKEQQDAANPPPAPAPRARKTIKRVLAK